MVGPVPTSILVTTADPIARLRDGSPVGAWLFKANPHVWDVLAALERRHDLDRWRLAWSYRVDLVDVGHPCALWVTGSSSDSHIAGLWAVGVVTSPPAAAPDDPTDPGWGPDARPMDVRPYVGVALTVLDEPIPRGVFRADPRLARTEVLQRPRMGSPLVLTPDEWAVLDSWTTT